VLPRLRLQEQSIGLVHAPRPRRREALYARAQLGRRGSGAAPVVHGAAHEPELVGQAHRRREGLGVSPLVCEAPLRHARAHVLPQSGELAGRRQMANRPVLDREPEAVHLVDVPGTRQQAFERTHDLSPAFSPAVHVVANELLLLRLHEQAAQGRIVPGRVRLAPEPHDALRAGVECLHLSGGRPGAQRVIPQLFDHRAQLIQRPRALKQRSRPAHHVDGQRLRQPRQQLFALGPQSTSHHVEQEHLGELSVS